MNWDSVYQRKRTLPVIRAAENSECGLVCLVMAANYFGHDVDLNGLRQKYPVSLAGAKLATLMDIANQLDISSRAIKVPASALADLPTPAILHWDGKHFVVLKSADRRGVIIHDPARGQVRLSYAEVEQHFTGVALELSRASNFEPKTARVHVRMNSLWTRMSGFWSAFGQLIFLAAVLQCIAFALPFQLQIVVDSVLVHGDGDLLLAVTVGFAGLVLLQSVLEAIRTWSMTVFAQMFSFQALSNLMRHLIRLPMSFFEKRHMGDLISRMSSANAIQDTLTKGAASILIDSAMLLAAVVAMCMYSMTISGIVFVTTAITLSMTMLSGRLIQREQESRLSAGAQEQSYTIETLRAISTIKVMGRETEREAGWRTKYVRVINASAKLVKIDAVLVAIQNLVAGIQLAFVVYLGAREVLAGQGMTVGMLMSFLAFRQTFTERAGTLLRQLNQIQILGAHVERVGDIIAAEREPLTVGTDNAPPRGSVELKGVGFSYGYSERDVLDGVDLEIHAGEFIAITGRSGGGKTTLMKILLGLYKPTRGEILLDGASPSASDWRNWREHIGVVAQQDSLLSGTIAENIAFFDPDLSMERVEAAAKQARIHNDVLLMPMQYMTSVGDMGSTLSGGQKQRVLIARALYRNPRVLFLDEGTANLDVKTEIEIAELLASLDITRIVVAHRPALIERADRVFTVSNGKIQAYSDGRDAFSGSNLHIVESREAVQ